MQKYRFELVKKKGIISDSNAQNCALTEVIEESSVETCILIFRTINRPAYNSHFPKIDKKLYSFRDTLPWMGELVHEKHLITFVINVLHG